MNRLAGAASPYLRQHADNPVHWWQWGQEALTAARTADKPLLISVGYASCHWCHVMAHESFEDFDTAEYMNQHFINIKIDREERPDLDALYMEALQTTSGSGGWPMTIAAQPDGSPFFCGTYFPAKPFGGRATFREVLEALVTAWDTRRNDIATQAGQLVTALASRAGAHEAPWDGAVETGLRQLLEAFDPEWGGLGHAPKFPQTVALDLLSAAACEGNHDARNAVLTTLQAMAAGGMHDHVGGGFARYSTDAFWMVPHFEKMLYDQAQLLRSYLRAAKLTGDASLLVVVDDLMDYVERDLVTPAGTWYCAEDADSEGEEGKFYVWRDRELRALLGDDYQAAAAWYGVTRAGNFDGANILHRPVRGDLVRPAEIERIRNTLLAARAARTRPGLDDKVLLEWNAYWISALAETGFALDRDAAVQRAEAGMQSLQDTLQRPDGRWLRVHHPATGATSQPAFAIDYAALVDAATRLYEASGRTRWLALARDSADALLDLFEDQESGGLFATGSDVEHFLVHQRDIYDGATPSANGLGALALLRLGAITDNPRYRTAVTRILDSMGASLSHQPTGHCAALQAARLVQGGTTEVVITGNHPELVDAVRAATRTDLVVSWGDPLDVPLWQGRTDGAFVCRGGVCELPTTDPELLRKQLML